MGVDVVILFEAAGELDFAIELPNGFTVSDADSSEKELGATHSIAQRGR